MSKEMIKYLKRRSTIPVARNSQNSIYKRGKYDNNLKKEAVQLALEYNNNSKAANDIKKKSII